MVSGTMRAARCLLLSSGGSGGSRGFAAARMAMPIVAPLPLRVAPPQPRPPLLPFSFSSPKPTPLPSFVPRSLKDAIESSPSPRAGEEEEEQPTGEVLSLFARSDVVCFDIDCTVTLDDSLDSLARFLGKGEAVAQLTSQAMEGTMPLEEALRRRLEILDVTPSDLARFHEAFPAKQRLTPGAKELISALTERGTKVFLISGGFRELALPVARALGVPADRLFANRMNFQLRDGPEKGEGGEEGGEASSSGSSESGSDGEEWGPQLRVAGFDPKEEVSANGGKPRAIQRIRASLPYSLVTMVRKSRFFFFSFFEKTKAES
jgi:glycerol-3-phosphate dehydrogenase (NAD+)